MNCHVITEAKKCSGRTCMNEWINKYDLPVLDPLKDKILCSLWVSCELHTCSLVFVFGRRRCEIVVLTKNFLVCLWVSSSSCIYKGLCVATGCPVGLSPAFIYFIFYFLWHNDDLLPPAVQTQTNTHLSPLPRPCLICGSHIHIQPFAGDVPRKCCPVIVSLCLPVVR